MIDISRQYLDKLSSCEELVGAPKSCFDHPKTQLIIEDGHKWFIDNRQTNNFDVIIMDALDPEDESPNDINKKLYNDKDFLNAAFDSLTENGVIIIQVGTAPNIHDPKADMGVFKTREAMFQMVEANPNTAAMIVYEEAHCGFNEPHSFLLICKSDACKEQWYATADVVDYQIYERIEKTKSGDRALIHYDGSTQHAYKYPPKAWETVYCRREPTPVECEYIGIPMNRQVFEYDDDEEISDFKVSKDEEGSYHVLATKDISKGSFVMSSHLASSILISERSLSNLKVSASLAALNKSEKIQKFVDYIENYGHESLSKGIGSRIVEIGASALIQSTSDSNLANVGKWGPNSKRPVFSPVHDRYRLSFDVFLIAAKDIKAGAEIVRHDSLWKD